MNRLLLLGVFVVQFYGCSDKATQDKVSQDKPQQAGTTVPEIKKDTSKNIYSDVGQSSFAIVSRDTDSGYDFKMVEVNYKIAFIDPKGNKDFNNYFAKYTTTTKSCTGCEEDERSIKVELNTFDNPKTTVVTLEQKCDELTLDAQTYKTVKYGCCGAEDQIGIYDYANKLIAEGDSKIVIGDIPNSSLKMYVGYKQETKDSTFLGTIFFSYNSMDRYSIRIKSNPLPEDLCNPYSPDMVIYSSNPKDEYNKEAHEYTFWSLDKLDDQSKINNLTLKVHFDCEASYKIDKIEIPIIKGKPNGKDDRNQIVTLKHK